MKKILLFAAFIYFLIAPLTYHPDNKEVLFWASQNNGSVWNIWEYGEINLPPDKQYGYPPFHFYLDKLQYAVAAPLAGKGFDEWIATPHKNDLSQPQLARFMMASKFSLIMFGLLAGYLIYLLAKKYDLTEKRAKIAAGIWLFNPITLYSIPMMGQNDVLAIVFFLTGWLLLFKYPIMASVIFGLAASIKIYPLIWLVFLLPTFSGINLKKKLWVFILSAVVYGLTLVPFLNNPTFLSVGMKPEVNARFLLPQISIGFDQVLYIIPVLLAIVFFAQASSPIPVLLTANLILLGFSHFHPQWYTWTVPFFALWIAKHKKKNTINLSIVLALVTVLSWMAVVILFADKWLSIGMFGVGNPALGNIPVLREYLSLRGIDLSIVDNLAHTALAAIGILALLSLITKKYNDQSDIYSFEKLNKLVTKWKNIPIVFRVIIVSLFTTGGLILWIGALQLIPSPVSTLPSSIDTKKIIKSSLTGDFVAEHNRLFRYDITLYNPERNNVGKFLVSLSEEGKEIQIQQISGLNIGEETTIRFDLPMVIENSKGKNYHVKIEAVEGTVSAAIKEKEAVNILANVSSDEKELLSVTQFFKSTNDINSITIRTVDKALEIVKQIPWYYAGIVVMIFLWI